MRTYLEGQVKYLEGKTANSNLVSTICQALASRDWVDLKRYDSDVPWSFDFNRQIILPSAYRAEDVRLFRRIATTDVRRGGKARGSIVVLQNAKESGSIVVLLNGKNYVVDYEANDTREKIASEIAKTLVTISEFEDTVSKGNVVTIAGTSTVYELNTSASIVASQMITASSLTDPLKDSVVHFYTEALKSGTENITINGKEYPIDIQKGDTKEDMARKLKNVVSTDFPLSSIEDSKVRVGGLVSVNAVSGPGLIDGPTATVSSVDNKVATIRVLLPGQAAKEGAIDITINGTTQQVPVNEGDTMASIAFNILQMARATWGLPYSRNYGNVVELKGGSGVSSISLSTDISEDSKLIYGNTLLPESPKGKIMIGYTPDAGGTTIITTDSTSFEADFFKGDSKEKIYQRIKDSLRRNGYPGTEFIGDALIVAGAELNSLSLSTDSQALEEMAVVSSILSSESVIGVAEIRQKVLIDEKLIVRLNGDDYPVQVVISDSKEDIATKIVNAIKGLEEYPDTYSDGVMVYIKGPKNVSTLNILPMEIPSANFEVDQNTITGKGTDSGTFIGDNVEIKVASSGTILDYTCFGQVEDNKGNVRTVAKVKSRPQGEVVLYEPKMIEVNETLVDGGDGQTFRTSKGIILDTEETLKRVKVLKDGASVSEDEYLINYFEGIIYFKKPQDYSQKMTITYTRYVEDFLGAPIPSEKYQIYNDTIIDITSSQELNNKPVIVVCQYAWKLQYPAVFDRISETAPRCLLKTSVDISALRNRSFFKDYYVEFRQQGNEEDVLTGFEIRFGTVLDESKSTIAASAASPWSRIAFFKKSALEDPDISFGRWLPVKYFVSYTSEFFNLVIQGDPSADKAPYKNYLIAHGFAGMLEQYSNAKNNNRENDFGICTGADYETISPNEWGVKTGSSTQIIIEKTGGNMPFQGYYPSFYTNPEWMDKNFIGPSEQTGHYHMSSVTATHSTERERGKLPGLLIGDRSAIFHLDKLISNKDEYNAYNNLINEKKEYLDETGNALISSTQKEWKMFSINTPYWFGSYSPNVLYGIAIRTK